MNDLNLLPGATIVWREGDIPTPWWKTRGMDNPVLHLPMSYKMWGTKIIKSYWVTRPALLARRTPQPRPAHG